MCALYTKAIANDDLCIKLLKIGENNDVIMHIINNKDLYVYGSSIWKMLTQNELCKPYDIDIVITNAKSLEFFDSFKKLLDTNKIRYVSNCTSGYQFSKFICRNYTFMIFSKNGVSQFDFTIIMDTITPEDFLDDHIPIKFLRNYYNDGLIHYNCEDLMNEDISLSKLIRHKSVIQKYTNYGVKFNVVNDLTQRKKTIATATLYKYINKYKKLGFVVVPLNDNDNYGEGKCPAVKNWCNLTLDNKINVNIYNNIGIVCGKNSGIMCIDVDAKDDGVKHFDQLVKKYKFPFGTPYQKTPNGGLHYIFKYNPEKMNDMQSRIKFFTLNDKKVGVDFWVNKVQFVAEPSINKLTGDKYEWVIEPTNDNIQELPDWVIDLYNKGVINEDYEIIDNEDQGTVNLMEITGSEILQGRNLYNKEEELNECENKEKEESTGLVSMFSSIYKYFTG